MTPSLLSNIPAAYRKWIITFAFICFLIGLGIGAFVAHKQQTTGNETPSAIPEAGN